MVEVLDKYSESGRTEFTTDIVECPVQREYIRNLMSKRGCIDNYDMFCSPILKFGEENVSDREFYLGTIDIEKLIEAYSSAKMSKKDYFVFMTSLQYAPDTTRIPDDVLNTLKQLASEGTLEMVISSDGVAKDGGMSQRSIVEFYYIFSFKEKNESVRFLELLTYPQELRSILHKSPLSFDDIRDSKSEFVYGFGRCVDIECTELSGNGYILTPRFYFIQEKELNNCAEGEMFVPIKDIFRPSSIVMEPLDFAEIKGCYMLSDFSNRPIDVLKGQVRKDIKILNEKDSIGIKNGVLLPEGSIAIETSGTKCSFLWNTSDHSAYIPDTPMLRYVLSYDNSIVDGAYITHRLITSSNNPRIEALSMYLHVLLGWEHSMSICEVENLKIGIPKSVEVQKEIVRSAIDKYKKEVEQEQKAERERLGILDASADIAHMLGTPFSRQAGIMLNLRRKIANGQPVDSEKVKKLMDTVDYVTRFIKNYCGNFEDAEFKLREVDILSFINTYCEEWKNSLGERFDIVIKNNILDSNMVSVDTRYLKVAFDSLFDNAYRHGFDKVSSLDNKVIISLSLVRYRNNNFVRIAVLNNGKPFADDFSLEVFKSRGRYTAKSGHTGLGGNHIYQIVHGHNGFLALNNSQGLTGFDILLPVNKEISNTEYIYNYDKETI